MLDMEEFLMLRDLFNRDLSISEIARRTGHSRGTIRKYLSTQAPVAPQKKSKKPSKLDDYREYIISRVHDYPLSASRIYREIQDQGFTGKYTIVKDFIRSIRPKTGVSAVYRFETKPGIQSQVDWAECGQVEIDGMPRKLFCFTMILGYSRMRYAEFTLSIDVHSLIQCHLNAFHYFGGYTDEILYDNMKQVVLKRGSVSSNSTWNSEFEDFFKYYGFIPRLCRPYRPQTKGKIENSVAFVKRDFLLGSEFQSFSDINFQKQKWLDRVNSCIHGTTNEIPLERLKKEDLRDHNSVPPYRNVLKAHRKISRDAYVSYLGNRYSVPYRYAGRECVLQVSNNRISIVIGKNEICTHELKQGHGIVSRNKDHFKGLLSEILKQNSGPRQKCSALFRFAEPQVEQRSLSIYDCFAEGIVK
jgi:transposase